MALNVETEQLTCDTEGCNRTANLSTSHAKGWYFTVEDVVNKIATYQDYCPDHAKGRKRNITPADMPTQGKPPA